MNLQHGSVPMLEMASGLWYNPSAINGMFSLMQGHDVSFSRRNRCPSPRDLHCVVDAVKAPVYPSRGFPWGCTGKCHKPRPSYVFSARKTFISDSRSFISCLISPETMRNIMSCLVIFVANIFCYVHISFCPQEQGLFSSFAKSKKGENTSLPPKPFSHLDHSSLCYLARQVLPAPVPLSLTSCRGQHSLLGKPAAEVLALGWIENHPPLSLCYTLAGFSQWRGSLPEILFHFAYGKQMSH